jgi:NAD-dependent deacetylase
LAQQNGAKLVEVNLEETPLSAQADASFWGKAGELLPRLLETAVKP